MHTPFLSITLLRFIHHITPTNFVGVGPVFCTNISLPSPASCRPFVYLQLISLTEQRSYHMFLNLFYPGITNIRRAVQLSLFRGDVALALG